LLPAIHVLVYAFNAGDGLCREMVERQRRFTDVGENALAWE